jgi:hypothetical protein
MPAPTSQGKIGRKAATRRQRLSRERRHVLQVLAKSGEIGLTEAVMMAHGCSAAMLAAMASDGFIAVAVDTFRSEDRTIKVRRFRITDIGRKAIEDAM